MKQRILYIAALGFLIGCTGHEAKEHQNHAGSVTPIESSDLMLNDSQLKLANVRVERISFGDIGQTTRAAGKLVLNQEQSQVISARSSGRIEKLYRKETGYTIKKGEPLYDLYSEPLLTYQKEYLLAKEQFEKLGAGEDRYKAFFQSARQKLLLYGLTSEQIDQLGRSGRIQERITFLAPVSGLISEIDVTEGQNIGEGATLFKIENMTVLWIEAELYPSESAFVRVGDKIKVLVNGFSPVDASVSFLSPEYRESTQIVIMRAAVDNKELKLQPGMEAQASFAHSSKKSIVAPVDAVIRDGNGAHVYVQRGKNTFRPQMIKTGIENASHVEITEGLEESDTIVVSGAYLLYSELVLKKGTDPMAGHVH